MRFALVIHRLLTDNGVELVTRIAGLLLAAIAVQLVANSAIAFSHSALSIGRDRSVSCGRKGRRTSHTGKESADDRTNRTGVVRGDQRLDHRR